MLIALIGPPGSGKASVARYLSTTHNFRLVTLDQNSQPLLFGNTSTVALPDSKRMLDWATDRWNKNYVTLDLVKAEDLEMFIKRPFFLCVEVDGPVMLRWGRWKSKHGEDRSLDEFVRLDDQVTFGSGPSSPASSPSAPPMRSTDSSRSLVGGNGILDNLSITDPASSSGLNALRRYVHLRITNTFPTLMLLHAHLTALNLPSTTRLRPDWDTYFLTLCNLASLRSNCMKRRVGAVLVSSNRILSTGYNGTPSGLLNCNAGGCGRCNNTSNACGQNLEECLCLHAEENALLEAGRAKITPGLQDGERKGATMYCNTCPCLRCAVKIIQTGIRKVVYQLEYSMDERTKAIFKEAGVEIQQVHLDT